MFGTSFVIAGRLRDRLGPFKVSVVGSIGLSLGFVLASSTRSLGWIFFTFGGIMGFGNGFGYATPIPVLSKWFPDRRGLAVGLAVAGYGGGSAILAIIGPPMLAGLGWRGTFLWLGIGCGLRPLQGKMETVGAFRTPVEMVGGLATSFLMELLVYPAIYLLWKSNGELKAVSNADRSIVE